MTEVELEIAVTKTRMTGTHRDPALSARGAFRQPFGNFDRSRLRELLRSFPAVGRGDHTIHIAAENRRLHVGTRRAELPLDRRYHGHVDQSVPAFFGFSFHQVEAPVVL